MWHVERRTAISGNVLVLRQIVGEDSAKMFYGKQPTRKMFQVHSVDYFFTGLYVGGCGVSNVGAKDIANVLPHSLHLETLCLGHCAIGDDGASALARALAENHALRR